MLKLNLPDYKFNLKKINSNVYIFDIIRKKYVKLTPEEWVRQNFISYLISEKKVGKNLISVESQLIYNKRNKRTDIVVFSKNIQPYILVECKASNVQIDENVILQISTYNKVLKVPFLCITNGLTHIYAKRNDEGNYDIIEDLNLN